MRRRLAAEIGALVVMAGSLGLVLITLSGSTRDIGIAISVISILGQLASIAFTLDEGDDE